MIKGNYKLWIFWLANIIAAILFYFSVQSISGLYVLFEDLAYYAISGLFLIWVYAICYFVKTHWQTIVRIIKTNWVVIITGTLLTSIVFLTVPAKFKVLSDETNVVATSKAMLYDKKVHNSTQGIWYYENYHSLEEAHVLRPITYAYFLHLAHAVSGYRVSNAFAVNLLALCLFLVLIGVVVSVNWGLLWGVLVQLAIVAQPLVSQIATSGGIDLFSLVFFGFSMTLLFYYLKNPGRETLLLLVTTLLVYSNTRYESIFVAFLLLGLLVLSKKLSFIQLKSDAFLYSLVPLLYLPSLWQRLFKFYDGELPVGESSSLANAYNNTRLFLSSVFTFDLSLPLANLINIIGLLGGMYLLFYVIRHFKAIKLNERWWLLVVLGALCLLWLVIVAFDVSLVSHPSQSRLFAIFICALSVLSVWACFRFFKKGAWAHKVALLIIFVGLFFYYLPISSENRFVNKQIMIRQYDFTMEFLDTQLDRNFLIVTDRPGMYTVHNMGAISFEMFNDPEKRILEKLGNRLIDRVYIIQELDINNMSPISGQEVYLPNEPVTLAELQNTTEIAIRISEFRL